VIKLLPLTKKKKKKKKKEEGRRKINKLLVNE